MSVGGVRPRIRRHERAEVFAGFWAVLGDGEAGCLESGDDAMGLRVVVPAR